MARKPCSKKKKTLFLMLLMRRMLREWPHTKRSKHTTPKRNGTHLGLIITTKANLNSNRSFVFFALEFHTQKKEKAIFSKERLSLKLQLIFPFQILLQFLSSLSFKMFFCINHEWQVNNKSSSSFVDTTHNSSNSLKESPIQQSIGGA